MSFIQPRPAGGGRPDGRGLSHPVRRLLAGAGLAAVAAAMGAFLACAAMWGSDQRPTSQEPAVFGP